MTRLLVAGRKIACGVSRPLLGTSLRSILCGGGNNHWLASLRFVTVQAQQAKQSERHDSGDLDTAPEKHRLLDLRGAESSDERLSEEDILVTKAIRKCFKDGDWAGGLSELRLLEERLSEQNRRPTYYQYATALDGCTKGLCFKEAWDIWQRMPTSTHMPSRVGAFNMMIKMHRKMKKLAQAEALFSDMQGLGLQPSIITYAEMIQAYSMGGRANEAVAMLKDVRATPQYIESTDVTKQIVFQGAMTACARQGEYTTARAIFEDMRNDRVPALNNHFNSLITACVRHCDVATADAVFAEMVSAGLQPRSIDYAPLLACNRKNSTKCEALLIEMQERGLKPVRLCYEAAAEAALETGNAARAKELLMRARSHSDMPPTKKTLQLENEVELATDSGAKSKEHISTNREAAVPNMDSLPNGWHATTCPSSGRPYYWNQSDPAGTVTWVRPR